MAKKYAMILALLFVASCGPKVKVVEVFDPAEWIFASWASPEDAIWFAGGKGQITRVKNDKVDSYSVPTALDFTVIWGCQENRLWAAGGYNKRFNNEEEQGMLWEWDGHAWKRVPTSLDTSVSIRFLGGSSCEDVWIGGWGKMAHYDGKSWSEVPYPPGAFLFNSVAVVSPTQAYASDTVSKVYQWDGTAWKFFEHRAVSNPKDLGTFDGSVRGVKIIDNHLVAWWDSSVDSIHAVAIFKENKWQQVFCRDKGLSEITAVAGESIQKLWVTTGHVFPGGPLFEIKDGQCRKLVHRIGTISTLSTTRKTLWLGGNKIMKISE